MRNIAELSYNKVAATYMLRLGEFRNLYANRHKTDLMDDFGSDRSNLLFAIGALKEVRIYRHLLKLVSADLENKNL